MARFSRFVEAAGKVVRDPRERRSYLARLEFLARGTGGMQAWSLEYRRGLEAPFQIEAEFLDEDPELVLRCPDGCSANAPIGHLFQRRSMYRIKNTVVSTSNGATIQLGGPVGPFFIRESITWPFESIIGHGLELPRVKQAQDGPTGDVVVAPSNPNYYHWLIEELPLVMRAHVSNPRAIYLVCGDAFTTRHQHVAETLGITLTKGPAVARLSTQILPGRSDDSWFPHPTDVALLRDFGSQSRGQSERPPWIYVSRKSATRSIPHEEELETHLVHAGFTIIRPERMSWADQIDVFRHAQVVAGPHGAGLSNLVFAEPGTRLIELVNGMHYNRCFEFLCHAAGHDYVKIDAPASTSAARSPEAIASDIADIAQRRHS